MLLRRICLCLLVVFAAACDRGPGDEPASVAVKPEAAARRAKLSCAQHYAEARGAILDTLRGVDHRPLIQLVTQLSVTGPQADPKVRLQQDCGFFNRQLHARDQPAVRAPRELSAGCAAWVERIDERCLKPLQERGQPLDRVCHQRLTSISARAEDLDAMLKDDAACALLADGL